MPLSRQGMLDAARHVCGWCCIVRFESYDTEHRCPLRMMPCWCYADPLPTSFVMAPHCYCPRTPYRTPYRTPHTAHRTTHTRTLRTPVFRRVWWVTGGPRSVRADKDGGLSACKQQRECAPESHHSYCCEEGVRCVVVRGVQASGRDGSARRSNSPNPLEDDTGANKRAPPSRPPTRTTHAHTRHAPLVPPLCHPVSAEPLEPVDLLTCTSLITTTVASADPKASCRRYRS